MVGLHLKSDDGPGTSSQVPAQSLELGPTVLGGVLHVSCEALAGFCQVDPVMGEVRSSHDQGPVSCSFAGLQPH